MYNEIANHICCEVNSMSEDLQREIMALVAQINAVALVDRIYLFGSFAYGEPTCVFG